MKPCVVLLVGIVLLAALARLIPHPPNFTPIAAVALFGAAHFKNKWAAFLVPLLAMFISDAALEVRMVWALFSGWMHIQRGSTRAWGSFTARWFSSLRWVWC